MISKISIKLQADAVEALLQIADRATRPRPSEMQVIREHALAAVSTLRNQALAEEREVARLLRETRR